MRITPTECSALYSLVGRCLVLELDEPTIEMLRAPEIASVLGKLDDQLESYLNRDWTEAEFDEAAAEYCALFILPKGVSQTASYWIPGSTEDIGHQLVAGVSQVLETFDLSVEELMMGNVPRDNVGLLLLLAAHLYALDATGTSHFGDEFVAGFVSPWGQAFAEALEARTENPLYRVTGRLLTEILPTDTSPQGPGH